MEKEVPIPLNGNPYTAVRYEQDDDANQRHLDENDFKMNYEASGVARNVIYASIIDKHQESVHYDKNVTYVVGEAVNYVVLELMHHLKINLVVVEIVNQSVIEPDDHFVKLVAVNEMDLFEILVTEGHPIPNVIGNVVAIIVL